MSNLSRSQKTSLRKFARNNSQDRLYFMVHEEKVAIDAEKLAIDLGADPDVCWVAGLTHDLGYGQLGESEFHSLRSQKLVYQKLLNMGIDTTFRIRVTEAISNHDKVLSPSKVPLEDVIVCQVDAGSFFKYYRGMAIWLYHMRMREGDPSQRIDRVRNSLLSHSEETESYITMPEIKRIYEREIRRFKRMMGTLDVAKLIDHSYR